jgi:hypothetical protein
MHTIRTCPLCCRASDAAHEVRDAGAPCARCGNSPRTFAAAPGFHLEFCADCGPREGAHRIWL